MVNKVLLNFSRPKSVNITLQSEIAECYLAVMAMVAGYFGHKLGMSAMRKPFSANLNYMQYI